MIKISVPLVIHEPGPGLFNISNPG